MTTTDAYASARETTEGRVFTVTGGDWDEVLAGAGDALSDEKIVVNMGPQHPSTHGVLRLILELEGETVTEARAVVATPSLVIGRRGGCRGAGWSRRGTPRGCHPADNPSAAGVRASRQASRCG